MHSLRFLRFIEYSLIIFMLFCSHYYSWTNLQICFGTPGRELERLLICRNACGNSHEPELWTCVASRLLIEAYVPFGRCWVKHDCCQARSTKPCGYTDRRRSRRAQTSSQPRHGTAVSTLQTPLAFTLRLVHNARVGTPD